MIVDFFRRGTGASSGPIDYLLGKNRDREHATVLQGDVNEIAGLIDSSPYIKKYTAGCLSFYEHDLRPEQKQQIMSDFEKCLFPGMTKDQYRILWVEHQDKINLDTGETRLELNFLIPNVEVNSGKRLQPFYAAADLDRVECFKQITNHIHALYDPDDPAHRQATKVAKALPTNAKELKAAIEIEAVLAIGEGIISDRQSLVQWLTEIGLEVTRQTPKSVSVKHKDDAENARPIRLTGAMYEQDFRYTDESPELTTAASERYRAAATERYTASCERYDKMLAAKSEYHQQRYRPQSQRDPQSPERSYDSTIAADRAEHGKDQGATAAGHDSTIATATAADRAATSELAAVERLEPRDSRNSKDQENPYFIEYSLDFNSLYHAYQQHIARLYQQKQIQRTTSEISTFAADRISDSAENSGIQQNHNRFIQGERGQVDELGITAIKHYRAATAAVTERIAAIGSPELYNRAARAVRSELETVQRNSDKSNQAAGGDYQQAEKPTIARDFAIETTVRYTAAIAAAFSEVGRTVEYRTADYQSLATPNTDRNREATRTIDQTGDRENSFSRAISTRVEGFDTNPIHQAIKRLEEQRQQIQVEKKQDYGRDYDSPSQF
jgi:hypothetical protein